MTKHSATSPESHSVDAPLVLDLNAPPSPSLGLREQMTLWSSLGVSLLIPATAVFIVQPRADLPPLSLVAVIVAIIAGVAAGSTLLALAAVPGTTTGAPTAAMLRGLLGYRGAWFSSALNFLQCLGWAALEVYVIAEVGTAMTRDEWRIWWVLGAGGIATVMAVRPLRSVRVIRRYLIWLVIAATIYLFVVLVKSGLNLGEGSWSAFWPAFDIIVTMPLSWALLASDWSRHSTSRRATVLGTGIGYGLACAAFFTLGVLAIANQQQLGQTYSPSDFVTQLLALPVGVIAVLLLAVDEVDEAFANIYSTALTAQNFVHRADRRVLAGGIGALATALAAWLDLEAYESFLLLIGAVFLPLVAVLLTDWFIVRRITHGQAGNGYDVATPQRWRGAYLGIWIGGVCIYSTVSPAQVAGWADFWNQLSAQIPWFRAHSLSATLVTLIAVSAATVTVGVLRRR